MSWSWDEVVAFATETPRLGRLATAGSDGEPHVVPIWFRIAGGDIHIHSMRETGKTQNIAENGRASLVVDTEDPPYKGVTMRGPARLANGDELDWRALVAELAVTYLGDAMGPGYADVITGVEGEHVTIVLSPDDWEAWDYSQA